MTRIVLRKSTDLALWSVSLPWSMICNSRLKTSGWAFSISSSSSTAWGCWSMASVIMPPWSNPTYPGGAPIRRDTVCRSMYSDMSKRTSSHAHEVGELARDLRLADARRTREQIAADGLLGFPQSGPGQLDRARQGADRLVLSEDHRLQVAFDGLQDLLVALGHRPRGDTGDLGDDRLHLPDSQRLAPPVGRLQHLRGAGLVDDVDGLVGQLAVVDVAGRQLHRRADRFRGVADLVMLLEIRLESP